MKTLNSVKRLLLYLNMYSPGQWVSITYELGRIFEGPADRFKDPGYTGQIRAFLSGMEDEGLIQLDMGDQDLHHIRAKLTKTGLEHIGRLNRPAGPIFYLGQNAHFIYQSPDARIRTSNSNQTPLARNEPLANKLTRFATTMTGTRAVVIATFSFLSSLGIFFGLWKTNNLPTVTFISHKAIAKSRNQNPGSPGLLLWPSNLRYIDLDTVTGLCPSDLIILAWVKGHVEDSAVALRLYIDLKNAGYKPQLIEELALMDKIKIEGRQFSMDLQLLHDYSRRIYVIINPEFNFFKE